MKHRIVLSFFFIFIISIKGDAQIDSINFCVGRYGNFTCNGNEFMIINYPNESKDDLYHRFVKKCHLINLMDNITYVHEIGGYKIVAHIEVKKNNYILGVDINFEFKEGRVKITPKGKEGRKYDSFTGNNSGVDFSSVVDIYLLRKPDKKRNKEMIQYINNRVNTTIKDIMQKPNALQESDDNW